MLGGMCVAGKLMDSGSIFIRFSIFDYNLNQPVSMTTNILGRRLLSYTTVLKL